MKTFLDEANLISVAATTDERKIKELLNEIFWNWFETAKNRKVTTIKIWFLKKTLYIRDLEGVFALIFGPHPA